MKNLMSKVENMTGSGRDSSLCNYNHAIDSSDVSNAIFKLKARKAGGTNNVRSHDLINSSPSVAVHILLLVSAILRHGASPDNTLLAILIPFAKSVKKY